MEQDQFVEYVSVAAYFIWQRRIERTPPALWYDGAEAVRDWLAGEQQIADEFPRGA